MKKLNLIKAIRDYFKHSALAVAVALIASSGTARATLLIILGLEARMA